MTSVEMKELAERCLMEAIRIDQFTITSFPTASILREAGKAILAIVLERELKAKEMKRKEKEKECPPISNTKS